MTDHPDHAVRKQRQFVMLRRLQLNNSERAWGVKLKLSVSAGGTSWQSHHNIKWCYGPTAEAALDEALAYLVSTELGI